MGPIFHAGGLEVEHHRGGAAQRISTPAHHAVLLRRPNSPGEGAVAQPGLETVQASAGKDDDGLVVGLAGWRTHRVWMCPSVGW